MVKVKNANVGRDRQVKVAPNYEDWTKKKRKIAPGHQVDLSDMGGIEIIPALFQDIGWGSLLIVNELFYPMMLYEFYANLQRGRIQTSGDVVTSRVNGKNISFDDRLLNSILGTPKDGMLFYTKSKKCFDPNMYSEKRFEELFTKEHMLATQSSSRKCFPYGYFLTKVFQHFKITFFGPNDHTGIDKKYNQNTFKRMGFSRNEDGKLIRGGQEEDSENREKEEEEGNEPEMWIRKKVTQRRRKKDLEEKQEKRRDKKERKKVHHQGA
ncbi:hypothetical protein M9H77_02194 [Catharanthus roseus]|uniref:Uncharacterized protein n=1 Tax=Catharanthus roseus TaxID=4058 RepID=A0ACC0C808_CATRO|nr:hypothetical protein M9H77_02194 [Catharanthus roseus]